MFSRESKSGRQSALEDFNTKTVAGIGCQRVTSTELRWKQAFQVKLKLRSGNGRTDVGSRSWRESFSKKLLMSMIEMRIAGSLVRRLGSAAQPPRWCASCFGLKVGTDCGNHANNVPPAHIWSTHCNLWFHDFYDGNERWHLLTKLVSESFKISILGFYDWLRLRVLPRLFIRCL